MAEGGCSGLLVGPRRPAAAHRHLRIWRRRLQAPGSRGQRLARPVNVVETSDVPGTAGRREITFANAKTITTDLLIGADGAWSKVRPLLTDARPTYTGISFIEADLFDGAEQHPAEAAAMGPGMLFAFRDDTGILGHTETDGNSTCIWASESPRSRRTPSTSPTLLLPSGRFWPGSTAGTMRSAASSPAPTPRSSRAASTPFPSGSAGTAYPGSPSSATLPT